MQACGGCYKELADILCDLRFIHAKCSLGLSSELLADFSAAGSALILVTSLLIFILVAFSTHLTVLECTIAKVHSAYLLVFHIRDLCLYGCRYRNTCHTIQYSDCCSFLSPNFIVMSLGLRPERMCISSQFILRDIKLKKNYSTRTKTEYQLAR